MWCAIAVVAVVVNVRSEMHASAAPGTYKSSHNLHVVAAARAPPAVRRSLFIAKMPGRGLGRGASGIRNVGSGRVCHFEDSDGNCWEPGDKGVCGRPRNGGASALIQHADFSKLCEHDPPYGFRALCTGPDAQAGLRAIRRLRDPAKCKYKTCALVGASGTLLGARLGKSIDAHDAVLRINFAPDGPMAARTSTAPHRHLPTWIADVGARTTWRILTMEGYGYLRHYPRFWLKPPKGHGSHENMSGIPQQPLLAVSCHTPGHNLGRCRIERIQQVFGHPWSASYLINPVLMDEVRTTHFKRVKNQKTLSTGMTAIAFATRLCGEVHLYGFGNGSCGDTCYHYYDCGPTAGTSGLNQSTFLTDSRTSGGFHNFSAQANVLLNMARSGVFTPHWGNCVRNLGGAPSEYANTAERSPTLKKRRRGRGRGRGKGRGKAG